MSPVRLISLILLAAAPAALAQPIIIPLEKQPAQERPPVASAPPVAPPVAGPTQQEPAVARGEPDGQNAPPQEEASQPAPKGE